jgi:hypothetical protein
VSYDLTIIADDEAVDGDDTWRSTGTTMGLIVELLDLCEALDADEPGPWPDEDRPRDAAVFQRWHAEQRNRVAAHVDDADRAPLRVPFVKFSSNDPWEVFPAEAGRMASALRSEEAGYAALVALERVMENNGLDESELPSEESVLRIADRFAEFCERAARYGGFRVG